MTLSAVALSVLNIAGLRLLCTISSCAGFAGILLGLRSDRKVRRSAQEPRSDPSGPDSFHESPAEFCARQEVIQLSNDPGPTKSSDMTQQQKIAAALTRAGIMNSAPWSTSEPSRVATAVMDPPPETPTAADLALHNVSTGEHSTFPRRVVLLTGSILLLLSLIMFLAIR